MNTKLITGTITNLYKACLCVMLLILHACSDVLDIKDLSNYSPDNVWNNKELTNAYLANLYSITYGGWPLNSGGWCQDSDGILGQGAIQPNNDAFKYWPYENIYKINTLLEGLEDDPASVNIRAQALVLRAYHYFKALVYHGGIPYITKVQQQGEDDLLVSRNSSSECFDLIINDINTALPLLEEKNKGDRYGYIDASYALALKAKILLYKASPQFNPVSTYANPYVDEAFNANKEAYETLLSRGYGLVDNYTDVFETKGHIEAVFAVCYKAPFKTDGRQERACRPLSETMNAQGGDQPTWSIIETFPMKDGKKPGESAKYPYDIQTYWKNRDPRFDQTIVWNGSLYELSGKKGRKQYNVQGIGHPNEVFSPQAQYVRTGFYTRKGIIEENTSDQVANNDIDWLEMRFAEVMFNYAEIACAKGITDVGYDVLKQIRKRAGIEPGDDDMYGLNAGMSAAEMRVAILEEKRIEFICEGQHFFDLRRNRMLNLINDTRNYGLLGHYKGDITPEVIGKANNWELNADDFTYTVQEVYGGGEKVMYLPDSYYFFPIRQSSIEKNENLKQNEGWGGTFNPSLE